MSAPTTNIDSFDPEQAVNDQNIEISWSVKTVEHLEAYEKLITSIPPRKIKLTSIDDDIYEDLMEQFPEFKFEEPLRHLNEDEMKSPEGKTRWRKFIMAYEKTLADYNFGTLIRGDADRGYAEDNAILVTRTQFVALEVARNRTGINDKIYEEAQAEKAKSAQTA